MDQDVTVNLWLKEEKVVNLPKDYSDFNSERK